MDEHRPVMTGSRVFWWMLKFVLLGPLLRLFFRPAVSGLEHIPREGGALVAANHVSFLDALILPLMIPGRRVLFLTKTKYLDKPFLHWFFRLAGAIPVEVDEPGQVGAAVTAGIRAVKEGRLVGIFPEGTRSRDGRLHAGKTGAARIAIQTGAPVIPAGITGTNHAFPRGAKLPRPTSVQIRFGPAIRFDGSVASDPAMSRRATQQIMAAIAELSGEQRASDFSSTL